MNHLKNKKTIIWDWNGTLLNDTELCVACMNKVLTKRNMKRIDVNIYRDYFTFPVKNYYKAIGFDFKTEDFEIPAMEFINHYYSSIVNAELHPDTFNILDHFKNLGFKQLVLSAMEHNNLESSLTSKGIIKYFDDVSGINDHYAHSKLEIGIDLINRTGTDIETAVMVGDTVHDLEVSSKLGIDCILVSNGHQSNKRLLKETTSVYTNLMDIMSLF